MNDKKIGGKRVGAGRPRSRLVLRTGQVVSIIFSAPGKYDVGSGRVDVVDQNHTLIAGAGWNLQIITEDGD